MVVSVTTLIKIAPSITLSPLTLLYLYSLHLSLLYTVLCNTLIYLLVYLSFSQLKSSMKAWNCFFTSASPTSRRVTTWEALSNIHWVKKEGKGERKDDIKVVSEVSDLYNWTDGDGGATYWVGRARFRGGQEIHYIQVEIEVISRHSRGAIRLADG